MEEASVPCTIGELIDRGTSSYLFYQDEQADGTVYTAAGYALTQDGSYVYFELTSASPLDTATVDFEIAKILEATAIRIRSLKNECSISILLRVIKIAPSATPGSRSILFF